MALSAVCHSARHYLASKLQSSFLEKCKTGMYLFLCTILESLLIVVVTIATDESGNSVLKYVNTSFKIVLNNNGLTLSLFFFRGVQP